MSTLSDQFAKEAAKPKKKKASKKRDENGRYIKKETNTTSEE